MIAPVPAEPRRRGRLVLAGWIFVAFGALIALFGTLARVSPRDVVAVVSNAPKPSTAPGRAHPAPSNHDAEAQRARIAARAARRVAAVAAARAAASPASAKPRSSSPVPRPASSHRAVVAQRPVAPPGRARTHAPTALALRDEACHRALIYERTAAASRLARRIAYNAATAGLAMNNHCGAPQHDVYEAYLLASRAPAEMALGIGDWRRDLLRSDTLLAQCARRPQLRGGIASDCAVQLRYNARFRRTLRR